MSQVENHNKRLRLSDPDLKIVLKYDDAEGVAQTKEYQLYSQVMCSLSKFIDSALSHEMKDKNKREIVLEDVIPEIFDLAFLYVTDPLKARSVTVEDALKVVEFYDKFEFPSGLQLCDSLVDEYIRSECDKPKNLNLFVDCLVLAERLDLEMSKHTAVEVLHIWIGHVDASMFSVEHIKKLHPMLKSEAFSAAIADEFPGLTKEELDSPLFPKYFTTDRAHDHTASMLSTLKLTVHGDMVSMKNMPFSRLENSLVFACSERVQLGSLLYSIRIGRIEQADDDWVIFAVRVNKDDEEIEDTEPLILWKSPNTQNLLIPPLGPWEIVHEKMVDGSKPSIIF